VLKRDELTDPNSCLNRAKDDEMLFVLIERDWAMSDTIRYWAKRRVELGLNKADDAQIKKALEIAEGISDHENRK
jgi:hypothetical protein